MHTTLQCGDHLDPDFGVPRFCYTLSHLRVILTFARKRNVRRMRDPCETQVMRDPGETQLAEGPR